MSDPARKLFVSEVLNIFLTQSLVTFSCSYKKKGTGDAQGWRWFCGWFQRHSSPPNGGALMQLNGFEDLEKLVASTGIASFIELVDHILSRPETTMDRGRRSGHIVDLIHEN